MKNIISLEKKEDFCWLNSAFPFIFSVILYLRIRIQNPDSESGFGIRIRNRDSESGFGIRIHGPTSLLKMAYLVCLTNIVFWWVSFFPFLTFELYITETMSSSDNPKFVNECATTPLKIDTIWILNYHYLSIPGNWYCSWTSTSNSSGRVLFFRKLLIFCWILTFVWLTFFVISR